MPRGTESTQDIGGRVVPEVAPSERFPALMHSESPTCPHFCPSAVTRCKTINDYAALSETSGLEIAAQRIDAAALSAIVTLRSQRRGREFEPPAVHHFSSAQDEHSPTPLAIRASATVARRVCGRDSRISLV